ncbi:MAG: glucose-1-phosphate thymidylyltransferase [Fimbriimonadaceae bacterium]|nr:glucose-1-phosphate thymidylyltransferase [Fimbriimonadaceae bacterium]
MKALITSGGRGTRLRPITHTKNKHLIPIANKPILHYAIDYLRDAGITDIGVVYSADSREVPDRLGDGSQFGVSLTHIPQEAPLGLAHVVKISQSFIGAEPFVFYLGDNMVVGGIQRFVDAFQAAGSNCHLTLAKVKDPERFGVPELDGDRIVGIEEKPTHPKSKYAVAGIYLYDSSIFEACHAIEPSARGELEISDAHQWLLTNGRQVTYSEITGWWKDTGKPIDLLEANRLVLEHLPAQQDGYVDPKSALFGNVVVEEGAEVINSVIRGPAIIGKRTKVTDSYVGPFTSIYHDCTVRGSEIEYSIVLAGCQILDVHTRIEGSLLGDEVELVRAADKPRVNRFMLSDQSRVEIV